MPKTRAPRDTEPDETPWKQVNITYPGDRTRRERHAVGHLSSVMPAAESAGIITGWWFMRKHEWRVRYLLTDETSAAGCDPVRAMLGDGVAWAQAAGIYEPETHAFGGAESMDVAHGLFCADSRHLLRYLIASPADRREHALVLCTALMRAAGLDWPEQGDVWARIAEQRAGIPGQAPDDGNREPFADGIRHLLLGEPRHDAVDPGWTGAFTAAGQALGTLREQGSLTRGIRAVITQHAIFHFNRIGIPAASQAVLARAAADAVFA